MYVLLQPACIVMPKIVAVNRTVFIKLLFIIVAIRELLFFLKPTTKIHVT